MAFDSIQGVINYSLRFLSSDDNYNYNSDDSTSSSSTSSTSLTSAAVQTAVSVSTTVSSASSAATDSQPWWWSDYFTHFNQTSFNNDVKDLSSNLHPASDVDVNGVLTSAVFNFVIFVVFMLSYELLRRWFPNIYASKESRELMLEKVQLALKKKEEEMRDEGGGDDVDVDVDVDVDDDQDRFENHPNQKKNKRNNNEGESVTASIGLESVMEEVEEDENENAKNKKDKFEMSEGQLILQNLKNQSRTNKDKTKSSSSSSPSSTSNLLPDITQFAIPFQWVKPVYDVKWRHVREVAGLDAYFFLRYIRMCFKITGVSALWGSIILFPVYASGQNGAVGWYHVSMANVAQGSPIIWLAIMFIYFFSAFVLFVMKQEYKHFVEMRLDFLGKGDGSTDPQHHYSLMIESIPKELRSDSALFLYFNKLFPGKVHSANIILKVSELEALSSRKMRITRRLEKSIAYYEATGKRHTHIIGRWRYMICGVESTPAEFCCDSTTLVDVWDEDVDLKKGQNVDSIDYYTRDLMEMNKKMFKLQKQKGDIAAFGNRSVNGIGWFSVLSEYAQMFFNEDLSDSDDDDRENGSNNGNNNRNSNRNSNRNGNNKRNNPVQNRGFVDDDDDDDDSSIESLSARVYNRRASWKPISRYRDSSSSSPPKRTRSMDEKSDISQSDNSNPRNNGHTMYGSLEESKNNEVLPSTPTSSPSPTKTGFNASPRFTSSPPGRRRRWFGGRRTVSFKNDLLDTASDTSSKEEPLLSIKESKEESLISIKEQPKEVDISRLEPFLDVQEANEEEANYEIEDGMSGNNGCCNNVSTTSRGSSRSFKKVASKTAGRLGLDFGVYALKLISRRWQSNGDDNKIDSMSSTGFVTFLDLGTVTSVASTPLTHKPKTLTVEVAPEPRDILWDNCSHRSDVNERRATKANILLGLGAALWSIPLASIQALASAEQVAKIPGMEWISDFADGKVKALINAYLPVVALLALIMILPFVFEAVAVSYEKRKTTSDVNRSIVSRYFYYQLANIYISVTAGSIWLSASEIIERPSAGLEILGNSLPTVVGYFISLLVTKILGGLPMVILRVGALGRYLILRLLHRTRYLTQRELDNVYLVEPLYYGWEYPTQLLVIVICFTYACISPIILFFGALYFIAALMVYKKQVLYVYTPSYESGGDLFPLVCDRTIIGLICGQLTFMGYTIVRGGHFEQALSLLPLIASTLWTMQYFQTHFTDPSKRLTLELAKELDTKIEELDSSRRHPLSEPFEEKENNVIPQDSFDRNYYKQPVLTEPHGEPMYYRIERQDSLTKTTRDKLRGSRLHMWRPGRDCGFNHEIV